MISSNKRPAARLVQKWIRASVYSARVWTPLKNFNIHTILTNNKSLYQWRQWLPTPSGRPLLEYPLLKTGDVSAERRRARIYYFPFPWLRFDRWPNDDTPIKYSFVCTHSSINFFLKLVPAGRPFSYCLLQNCRNVGHLIRHDSKPVAFSTRRRLSLINGYDRFNQCHRFYVTRISWRSRWSRHQKSIPDRQRNRSSTAYVSRHTKTQFWRS